MSHGKVMCSCGRIIEQCRCPQNHEVTETRPHPACEAYGYAPKKAAASAITVKPRLVVEIEWDNPTDPNWLNADNVAFALHACCRNTKFVVREVSPSPKCP
jgi:hypothetical protein